MTSTIWSAREPVPLDLGLPGSRPRRSLAAAPAASSTTPGRLGRAAVVRVRLQVGLPCLGGDRPDDEVAGLAVDVDPDRVARVGHLAVGGQHGVLDGGQQRVRLDALLLLDQLDALEDLLAHRVPPTCSSATRFAALDRGVGDPHRLPVLVELDSVVAGDLRSPLKLRRPSTARSVRTAIRLADDPLEVLRLAPAAGRFRETRLPARSWSRSGTVHG